MPQPSPEFDFSEIVQNTKDVVIVTKADLIDPPGPEIIYVNQAFTEMTGYSAEEVIGKTPRILQSSDTEEKEKLAIRKALEKKESVRVTLRNYTKLGKEYWLISASSLFAIKREMSPTLLPFKGTSPSKKTWNENFRFFAAPIL